MQQSKNQLTLFDGVCSICGEEVDPDEIYFCLEKGFRGFWCDDCEGFTSFDPNYQRPPFTVFLETKDKENCYLPPSDYRLKKRLSPLRYPGGKSAVIPLVASHISPEQSQTLISPYFGGGSCELSLLEAGVVDRLIANDLDEQLINFYNVALHDSFNLIDRIQYTRVDRSLFEKAKKYVTKNAIDLSTSECDAAFYFLLNNRLSFSGIFNAGCLGGKNGSIADLTARYNPAALQKQIETLHSLRDKIELHNGDALLFIEEACQKSHTTALIDPPYIGQGKRLYKHHYSDFSQHFSLIKLLRELWVELPDCQFIVFYDDAEEVEYLPLDLNDTIKITRYFQISNGNSKQTEDVPILT